MNFVFHVGGDPDALLAELCPIDEQGYVDFVSAGRSRAPTDHEHLLEGQVEFRAYVMEGFITYTLSLERASDGLRFIVRKAGGSGRDDALDWFFERYLRSQGSTISKHPL